MVSAGRCWSESLCFSKNCLTAAADSLSSAGARTGDDQGSELVQGSSTEDAGLDGGQRHGGESPETCRGVPGRTWKAVHLDRDPGLDVEGYPVDAFLIDSYSGKSPGGTGITANWDRAATFVAEQQIPVILAGGLRPDNVRESILRTRPWGVDVSSGVEAKPGEKDLGKVKEFIWQCRSL